MPVADAHIDHALLALKARLKEARDGKLRGGSTGKGLAEAGSFRDFVVRRNPGLLHYEHVPKLVSVAQRVADGELSRVIINMGPRYFKSEVWSRLFTGYYIRRYPDRYAALVSYGSGLALDLSGESRAYYQDDGGRVSPTTDAKHRWDTSGYGGMWAAGLQGGLLGFGFHVAVVDDPLNPRDRRSLAWQQRFPQWWEERFINRQEPGAAIVVVMQRLGTDDPVDYLYRREVGEDTDLAPEGWHVVVCDEIKDDAPLGRWDGPRGLPPTCTIEPDDRKVGEVLAPSRFNIDQVKHMQVTSGVYTTASQRQQRPMAPSGDYWKDDSFDSYDVLPESAYNLGWDWDLAYTKQEANSASAGLQTARGLDLVDPDGKRIPNTFPIYIEDVTWDWVEFPELLDMIREREGPHHIEAKASGKSAAQSLRREGIKTSEVQVHGDKLARANAVQPIVAQGRVYVRARVRRKLLHGARQGLLHVRAENLAGSKGDLDVNDTLVQCLHRHVGVNQKRRFAMTPSSMTTTNGQPVPSGNGATR